MRIAGATADLYSCLLHGAYYSTFTYPPQKVRTVDSLCVLVLFIAQ
jgi:hypothetical protein